MTFVEYQTAARRTQNKDLSTAQKLEHAKCGMVSEMGEIFGIFQKELQGHPVDIEHIIEETGDLLWFLYEFAESMGFNLEWTACQNIEKLWKRYPGHGFDSDRSVHRPEYERHD